MSNPSTPQRIVIVGGGLAGTLVAVHLLRRAPSGTLISLGERGPLFGRGVASATDACVHLLNVPAGRMSAFPDRPDHFVEWVRERTGRAGFPKTVNPDDFLPRCLYGDYIGYVLTEARQQADPSVSFTARVGEVVDIDELPAGGAARVFFSDGTTLVADQVVLALGNLPGEYPVRSGRQVYRSRNYVHVPWAPGVIEGIDPEAEVLIAGQGLSATDIVIQLAERGHRGRIGCLSRRGLRPLPHRRAGTPYRDFLAGEPAPATIRALVRRIREEVRTAAEAGGDWRDVIDAIRPHSARLWAALDWSERARFMRHVRPYWEVHRHRLAPEIAARLQALVDKGRLEFLAGRFRHLEETADGLRVIWRPKGSDVDVERRVAKLINCTGPRTDYSKYQHPLFINLLARGLLDHDPLALGIAATPDGRVRRYRGGVIPWLHTLGAPLRGVLWECAAVREIREQAAAVAGSLLTVEAGGGAPSRFQRLVEEAKSHIVEVGVEELRAELAAGEKSLLIDIREPEEHVRGGIPGATHVPRGVLEGRIEQIAPDIDTRIVLYCAGGNRSALSAENLRRMGYTRVRSLAGGYGAWSRAAESR